jgi:salicylate hydroxylase
VASSRNIIVAGAGIGGLTAALALAHAGFRVSLLEQAGRLEESGAGIQLSPNATRILIALGLGDRLRRDAAVPRAVTIRTAGGADLARVPLGDSASARYGAPYWCIHRGDLQAALLEAVQASPDIVLRLGTRVEDFVFHAHGVSAACRTGTTTADEHGVALIGADGLWSGLRNRLGNRERPTFNNRTAWRAMVPTDRVDPEFFTSEVQLWLGHHAHLVHYPVKSGLVVNIVAIVDDDWSQPGWSTQGKREELLAHFSRWNWAEPVREFLAVPEQWAKWALHDVEPLRVWGEGPMTLLGDAAHPMLPFLAQGAATAIEDAAVLAVCLARQPEDLAVAMRRYERARRKRTARVQREARRNGTVYHYAAAEAAVRNLLLRVAGGKMLLRRYNWLYDWRAAPFERAASIDILPAAPPDDGEPEKT